MEDTAAKIENLKFNRVLLSNGLSCAIDYIKTCHEEGWISGGEGFVENLERILNQNSG